MDRFAADEASSDVVVADPPMALGARRGNGDQDTLYRRPSVPDPEPADSSWFADAAVETPAPATPSFGPTPPSGPGPGRTSFGFFQRPDLPGPGRRCGRTRSGGRCSGGRARRPAGSAGSAGSAA